MLKRMIQRTAIVAVLVSISGACLGGKPMSDSSLKPVGHDKHCVAADQYDFSQTYFLPVKFRPIAKEVPGLGKTQVSLDGKWRLAPKVPKDFQTRPAKGSEWHDFIVPGQWLQQGFDINPGEWWLKRDPSMGKPAAMMKEFEVPKSWSGKKIFLRFDAIHAGTTYWLNDKKLGYSENLFTPVELDITDAVRFGKPNRLALLMKVNTPSETAAFASGYAFHNLGGISRSVRIFALPTVHISRLHYTTPLDKDYRDATLSMDVSLDNPEKAAVSDMALKVKLIGPDGKTVKIPTDKFSVAAIEPGESRLSVKIPVTNPLKWSGEKPHLYTLTLELSRAGKVTERVEQAVGFRQIEIKNKQVYLNGKQIKLVGVLRHEVNPIAGRADTAKYGETDAKLFKEANFTYVRTIHYPPTREFVEACDRVGIYVEVEAPFCWTQFYQSNDPKLTKHFLTGTAAMLEYHRNSPSILNWSIVNESPIGLSFKKTLKLLMKEDPSRISLSNGGVTPECRVFTWHYPAFPFEDAPGVVNEPRPTLYDEYIPAMVHYYSEEYELNPGLNSSWSEGQNSPNSYISQVYASTQVVGGCICAVGDEDFYFSDRSFKGYGPWGFIDAWRRKKGDFWGAKCMHSPVWIPIREIVYKPGRKSVKIPIENRYSFTDLKEVKITWELAGKSGVVPLSLPPISKGEFEVSLPAGAKLGQMLVFSFTGADGRLISVHAVKLVTSTEKRKPYFEVIPEARPVERTIKLDGGFADWKDIKPLTVGDHAETVGDSQGGNDIESVWTACDADNLYISIKCSGQVTTKVRWALTSVLIDTDRDEFTGFAVPNLGIEYLVQPVSELRTDLTFLRRKEIENGVAWGGWHRPAVTVKDAYFVGKGDDNNRVEMRIPWENIGIKDPSKAKFRFRVVDGSVFLDESKGDWAPDSHVRFIPPEPKGGCPKWTDDGKVISIEGKNFRMNIEKSSGRILQDASKLSVPLLELPGPFMSLGERLNMFGPTKPTGLHYTEYPDATTRKIKSITAEKRGDALAIKVQESYKDISGSCEILIDQTGLAAVSYDYTYTGKPFSSSEVGLRFMFDKKCQEIRWWRDSEWDIYPDDSIGRPEGSAKAHIDKKWGKVGLTPYLKKPTWPWIQDENKFGTRDFRGSKYHIYEARLLAPNGSGMQVISNGTMTDVRVCLAKDGVAFHILRGAKPARGQNGIHCMRYFFPIWPGCKVMGNLSIQFFGATPAK